MKRLVKITEGISVDKPVYFVRYIQRRKYQWYCAAQFDGRYISREKVVEWVKSQPGLQLQIARKS